MTTERFAIDLAALRSPHDVPRLTDAYGRLTAAVETALEPQGIMIRPRQGRVVDADQMSGQKLDVS